MKLRVALIATALFASAVALAGPHGGPGPDIDRMGLLLDLNDSHKAEVQETFVEGLKWPHGMAFHNGNFYVADALGIYRYAYKDGDMKAGAKTQVTGDGGFGKAVGAKQRRAV